MIRCWSLKPLLKTVRHGRQSFSGMSKRVGPPVIGLKKSANISGFFIEVSVLFWNPSVTTAGDMTISINSATGHKSR